MDELQWVVNKAGENVFEKGLNMSKESTLPQLQRDEWKYLFDITALKLNSVPFVADNKLASKIQNPSPKKESSKSYLS